MSPTVAGLLKRAIGGERVIDLLFHLPEGYLDRRARPTLKQALQRAKPGQVATLAIEVVRHEPPGNPRQPWRVVVTDGTGFAELVFFHFTRAELMAPGAKLLVSGKLERYGNQLTMPHPDYVVPATQPERIPDIDPAWRLTAGLWPRQVGWAMAQALARLPALAGMARQGAAAARALAGLRRGAAPGPRPPCPADRRADRKPAAPAAGV